MTETASVKKTKKKNGSGVGVSKFLQKCSVQRQLIILVIPGILLVLIFNYLPMYGALIAFQNYNPIKGILGSHWVGLKYFKMFFSNPLSLRQITNTLLLGLYSLLWGFPAPIILALLMDQLANVRFKKTVQTISYFPHFISMVVVVGMLKEFLSVDGFVNAIRQSLGAGVVSFMTEPGWFRTIYVSSGVWQDIGWGTIIYLAALSNVDSQLMEAATIDGANRWQKVRYISWPAIAPTTTILLIFAISGILGNDFQKILLMYSPATYSTADVISTYVYREGIEGGRYEFATAIGLLMSVISCCLIVVANRISRTLSDTSLW